MSKTIKIGYTDFWSTFKIQPSLFYDLIVMCGYEPIIDNDNPDVLFYSVFGKNHLNYSKPIKIWFSGENWGPPDFNQCHYALSGYYLNDPRHYRTPLYLTYHLNHSQIYEQLTKKNYVPNIKEKTKFCNFVYSNCVDTRDGVVFRNELFRKLSQYKQVDSGGSCLNNIGYKLLTDKITFIKDYKFTIAVENSSNWNQVHGYTTEKILQPMICNSIPIYYGNKDIHTDFNTKSFINYYDFNDIDKMIYKVIEIDNDDDLYLQYLSEPFVNDFENSTFNTTNLVNFIKKIINE